MENPLIINVQKCSIHDGPGIRTTVFFKGCPLECVWCHNPESQSFNIDFLYDKEKCTDCCKCIEVCKSNAVFKSGNALQRDAKSCSCCGDCIDWCLAGCRELVGENYEIKELIKKIEKDRMFYEESGGGVTLSGGEVMCQNIDYLSKLIKTCKNKGIHVAVDTCGYAPLKNFEAIYEDVDLFLYDIKLIDENKHIKFTGKSNDKILENLKYISSKGAKINIRIPLIKGVNVDDENIEVNKILQFLDEIKVDFVNLLPYHNIMINKYNKLGLDYLGQDLEKPSQEKMDEIKELFENKGYNVKIGG